MPLNGPHAVTHPDGKTVYFHSVEDVNAYVKEHDDFPDVEEIREDVPTTNLDKVIEEYGSQLTEDERNLLAKLRSK